MSESSPETEEIAASSEKLTWLESLALANRMATNTVVHVVLFSVALLVAFLVWFDAAARAPGHGNWFTNQYLLCLPFFIAMKLVIFYKMRLFRSGWQYASIRDATNIIVASWLFVAVTFGLICVTVWVPVALQKYLNMTISEDGPRQLPVVGDYFMFFPKGVLLLDFLATVFLVCTARLGFRIYREELRPVAPEGLKRVLLVGAGNAGEAIIREINRMRVDRYNVIGIVDDDLTKKGMLIHGVPVLGVTDDIKKISEAEKIDQIILAIPTATQKELRRVIEQCSGTKLEFKSLPGVGDLIDGRVTVSQIRPVEINDLLGREAVELDKAAVASFLRGRRVLITGAGGSIGSEMCRQVCNYGPAQLILVEQAENPLFDIENELLRTFPDIPVVTCVCDIYDRTRVMSAWEKFHPQVVIHAAAHKHVPLMERNPCEAIKNNILGTKNVADASCRHGTDEFVMISTDKAVNPSSTMGASKRVAEIYTQALNGSANCNTQFKAVRFGNVLGSAGSVVPTFRRQIAEGGPVRVTHPDMTRYFMTIPEAAQLVLQAAATGAGGQIFLLDMGDPVKIVDLAKQMITLSGFRPFEDIDIVFTGIRPGEKMFEELRIAGEDIEPTVHPKVRVWKCKPTATDVVNEGIAGLAALQNSQDRKAIVAAIQKLVPEYKPLNTEQLEKEPAAAVVTTQAVSP